MENKEEIIDLSELAAIAADNKIKLVSIITVSTVFFILLAMVLPKQYESTTLVQIRSSGGATGGVAGLAASLGVSGLSSSKTSSSPDTYIELMKSRAVINPIIEKMDWSDDFKERMTAKKFVSDKLLIENTLQTNLITITAKGKTPEEAQMISNDVVQNFLTMQTEKSQETQSLLVKFLNTRIAEAKNEADSASQRLADFSKEHKIYAPSGQVDNIVAQINAYDKTLSDIKVQEVSAQAQYNVSNEKLAEQKNNSVSYNINDNANVQAIRSKIITQQIDLTELRGKYTESHPLVIEAEEKLNQLQQGLADEVNAVVNSNTTSLNSAQMDILKNQYVAQAQIGAAKASEQALLEKKKEKEAEADNIPEDLMNYYKLESDSKIKNQIYTSLVQQCEQDKIKEAMESMDIQIIDEADLPKKPSSPKKWKYGLFGMLIGILISMIYVFKINKHYSKIC